MKPTVLIVLGLRDAVPAHWQTRLMDLGEVGHLSPAESYGEWPLAHTLIERLLMPRPAAHPA